MTLRQRHRLIEKNLEVAKLQARLVQGRIPRHAPIYEELPSIAMLALVQAAERFNPRLGVPFRAWAMMSCRRRIIDELRRVGMATGKRSQTGLRRWSNDEPLAEHADSAFYHDDLAGAIDSKKMGEQLRKRLALLPERERRILEIHYFGEVPFVEISQALAVNPCRISAAHREALRKLRQAA